MRITPKQLAEALSLHLIGSNMGENEPSITVPEVNRPGLQFAGYFEVFANERVQFIGRTEMAYLQALDPKIAQARLERIFTYPIPCVIVSRGMNCPEMLMHYAALSGVPVYGSDMTTTDISARASMYLAEIFAPRETIHGVLVDVYGEGILITGESGIGKSECALELLNHGHLLVADDVVDVTLLGTKLYGEAPEMVRDLMELRGVGIVDIKKIFGIGAITKRKRIDLVINIAQWQPGKTYDRLGTVEKTTNILGVDLPYMEIPVRPGRNLATIIEIAARSWSLRNEGYRASEELDRRLRRRYAAHSGEDSIS